MANIYQTIMQLIKPARVATASEVLSETQHKITAGVDIILPTLLAEMLKKHDSKEIEEVLLAAKHVKLYEDYDKIWRGSGVDEHENIGERMENRLLSPHDPQFNTAVGEKAGIKKEHADRLTNWVSGTIAAWIAQQMAEGKSYKSILDELGKEKAELKGMISADIIKMLGLEHALGIAAAAPHKAATHREETIIEVVEGRVGKDGKKKCGLGWLWWLLGILALAAIIFYCCRHCTGPKKEITTIEQVTEIHNPPSYEAIPMVLPDGTKITMYRGHVESAIKAFLDSDKFKNATDAELRSVWFEFSDIDFEHNSATDLMAGGERQLANLVGVIKNYPGVKIKIGAFADKTGTRAVNFAISKKRAENIEAALEKAGVHADHVSVEGFGEEYAKVAETASDVQRAPDRDIALRFTK